MATELVVNLVQIGLLTVASYYVSAWLAKRLKDQSSMSSADSAKAQERLEKLLNSREEEDGRRNRESLTLNQYEATLASDVIDPSTITTTFRDIGGIDHIKAELWDLVVLPLLRPDLFHSASGLVRPPRGVLLYGAPGTGKTMLAKAIAKEGKATFVNVRLSSIMDKWFGESNKLVAGTFSLARKLAPSVIFIDEIDTFLNQRDSSEGSATTSMKSEFLTLWDGMVTSGDTSLDPPVTVLGATNRPYDVDTAILRRLPRTFEIGLPNETSRLQILQLMLEKHELTTKAREMMPVMARVTKGYSGSDLKELCRAAAMEPIREATKGQSLAFTSGKMSMPSSSSSSSANGKNKSSMNSKEQPQDKVMVVGPPKGTKIRAVDCKDFAAALKKVKRTGEAAYGFQRKESGLSNSGHDDDENDDDVSSHPMGQSISAQEIARSVAMIQRMMMGGGVRPSPSSSSNKDEIDLSILEGNGKLDGGDEDDDKIPNL